jgi:hypothetical protein
MVLGEKVTGKCFLPKKSFFERSLTGITDGPFGIMDGGPLASGLTLRVRALELASYDDVT